MKRRIDDYLKEWKSDPARRVLLVRGARQVGKTYSIRALGSTFEHLLEANFEEHPRIKTFFDDQLSPEKIIEKLSAYFGTPVIPGKTILFFDEIQACPNCLRSLRFFHEEAPALHVAAAGSLLEFAISEIPSFGVGRITSLFMFPFSFWEFLGANGMEQLAAVAANSNTGKPVDPVLHSRLLEYLRTFCAIGGMPAVVDTYVTSHDLIKCQRVLSDIVETFRSDFAKYGKKAAVTQLGEVFESVALQAGGKFKYSTVNPSRSHYELKKAMDLLVRAGLVYQVFHTDARGIPLGAQIDPRRFKAMLFDTGIHQRLLNLDFSSYLVQNDADLVNKGAVAELFAGLEIIANSSPWERPQLHYWHREARNSNAEVDFVCRDGTKPLPVEVKSSRRGSMQSLHLFLTERNLSRGIRLSHENFTAYGAIETVPLYAAGILGKG
jgi:predicted AAA+ superfamily ATPase